MECSFGTNYGFCEREGFTSDFMVAVAGLLYVMHWTESFSFLASIMNLVVALPYGVLKRIVPAKFKPVLDWLEVILVEQA